MIKNTIITGLIVMMLAVFSHSALAQGMMGNWNSQVPASASADQSFEQWGEKWMEIMMGDRHEAIDNAIRNSSGEEGLKAMHERMGLMMGNPDASGQQLGYGYGRWGMGPWGMMGGAGMMGSNWGGYGGWSGLPMAGYGPGWGFFGWIFGLFLLATIVLYPVILVLGIRALWLWLKKHHS